MWVEDTLRQFGRNMGIEDLELNARGVCCLVLERRGTVYIERRGEEILVYLARQVPYLDLPSMKTALRLCHFKNRRPLPVVAGMQDDDRLIFLTRIEAKQFTLPLLERAIQLHTDLLERSLHP